MSSTTITSPVYGYNPNYTSSKYLDGINPHLGGGTGIVLSVVS
jgi:hypothetical protein